MDVSWEDGVVEQSPMRDAIDLRLSSLWLHFENKRQYPLQSDVEAEYAAQELEDAMRGAYSLGYMAALRECQSGQAGALFREAGRHELGDPSMWMPQSLEGAQRGVQEAVARVLGALVWVAALFFAPVPDTEEQGRNFNRKPW